MSRDIHYKGRFASVAAAWERYPAGGTDGDYIYIGSTSTTKIYWDVPHNRWSATVTPGSDVRIIPQDGSVTAAKIAVASVAEEKLQDASVGTAKLKADSVTTPKIMNGAVTNAKLASSSVSTEKIQDIAVTSAKLAKDAVTTPKIMDSAVTEEKLADGAVTLDKLSDEAKRNIAVPVGDYGQVLQPNQAETENEWRDDLHLKGGATLYASTTQMDDPVDAVPIDNETIIVNQSGQLAAVQGSGADFDETAMWESLENTSSEPHIIDGSHLDLTNIENDITDLEDDVDTLESYFDGNGKANSAAHADSASSIPYTGVTDAPTYDDETDTLSVENVDAGSITIEQDGEQKNLTEVFHPKRGSISLPLSALRITSAGSVTAYSSTTDDDEDTEDILEALPIDGTLTKEGGRLSVVGGTVAEQALGIAQSAYTMVEGVGTWLSVYTTLSAAIADVPEGLRRKGFLVRYCPTQSPSYRITVTSDAYATGSVGINIAIGNHVATPSCYVDQGDSRYFIATAFASAIGGTYIDEEHTITAYVSQIGSGGFLLTLPGISSAPTLTNTGADAADYTIMVEKAYTKGLTSTFRYKSDDITQWTNTSNWEFYASGIYWKVIKS